MPELKTRLLKRVGPLAACVFDELHRIFNKREVAIHVSKIVKKGCKKCNITVDIVELLQKYSQKELNYAIFATLKRVDRLLSLSE